MATNRNGNFAGKVEFVTGAASGIGRAAALAFAREGAGVVIAEEPVGRMGKPEEIAAAVIWLCSDAAAFMVGHAMVMDGGAGLLAYLALPPAKAYRVASQLGRPPAATKEAPMDGKVLQDAVIAPNDNWSAVLTPRQTLRIVDLEGKQAVDFLCYNADDVADRYNAADTMKYNKNVYLGAGHGIYSVRATKLFTIVADTMGGGHDTIGGCCSAASNMFRYKVPDTPSCYANFLRALAPHGMGEKDIVANINFFMNVPVQPDGTMGIVDGRSKPGDYVELRAESRVLAVVSNCPQTHNPCNGFNPTPIRVMVRGG